MATTTAPLGNPPAPSPTEALFRRDRVVVLAALAALTGVSWLYILQMSRTPASGMPAERLVMSCCGVDFWTTFLMWTVMMVGMMVPSVAPMVLTFATINRRRGEAGGPYVPTAAFLSGYLITWTAFSAVAALAQWALFRAALLDPHSQTVGPWLAGPNLLAAGVFQLSPAKQACLLQCRS